MFRFSRARRPPRTRRRASRMMSKTLARFERTLARPLLTSSRRASARARLTGAVNVVPASAPARVVSATATRVKHWRHPEDVVAAAAAAAGGSLLLYKEFAKLKRLTIQDLVVVKANKIRDLQMKREEAMTFLSDDVRAAVDEALSKDDEAIGLHSFQAVDDALRAASEKYFDDFKASPAFSEMLNVVGQWMRILSVFLTL